MAEVIIHHKGAYNLYSTVSDRPRYVSAITLKQLEYYIKDQYGKQGLRNLPERLKRAQEKGTSSFNDESLSETILCNRAGKNEEHLTLKIFIKMFLTL